MLDRSARLNSLNLQGCTDIGQRGGTEGQRFRVVLLPSLVLGAEVEGTRVLEVGGKHHGLVSGFSGKLDAQIPGVEGHKDEVKVLGVEMLGGEGIEAIDSVPESASISNVLPCQSCQACCKKPGRQLCGPEKAKYAAPGGGSRMQNLLHKGVIGVFTGLTSTLSW